MITTTGEPKTSMNAASAKDPFNNNCYGTLVDTPYKLVSLPVLDVIDFNERIIRGYEEGYGEKDLPADLRWPARSCRPAPPRCATSATSPRKSPMYITENCTGCMDCVTECPDTAILGKVLSRARAGSEAADHPRGRPRYVPQAVVQDEEVLRRRGEEEAARRHVQHHHRPVASARAAPSASPSATTTLSKWSPKTDEVMTQRPQEPSLLQEHRPQQQASTSTRTCSST